MRIKRKTFASKMINNEILASIAKLFYSSRENAEDTVDEMDEDWFHKILEPKEALYHLGYMEDKISREALIEAILPILKEIEKDEKFQTRIDERKNNVKAKKKEVYSDIFVEMWNMLISQNEDIGEAYDKWLQGIGTLIEEELNSLMPASDNETVDFSVQKGDVLPYGGEILERIFDAKEPISLVVEEVTMTSKPSKELIDICGRKKIPLRFCLRDTMGLTQAAIDYNSMKDALEIALNCNPDNILLMINLEDREDVIKPCCEAITKKIAVMNERRIPLNIFFSKADQTVESFIDKIPRNNKVLSQKDYDDNVQAAIESVDAKIKDYVVNMPPVKYQWGSLRFKEQGIDPVQTSLASDADLQNHFNPNGLYQYIKDMVNEAQQSLLPSGYKNLVVLNVKDPSEPACKVVFDKECAESKLREIQQYLGTEKSVINGYLIKEEYPVHWRSVQTYYSRLQQGLGHTTRANVYANFSINMKGVILRSLLRTYPDINSLCDKTLKINTENVSDDSKAQISEMIANGSAATIMGNRYLSVLDVAAFRLSYTNEEVRKLIDEIYYAPISYDESMKRMQKKYQEFFLSERFTEILVNELESAMTLVLNKSFIAL
ncbi:MAG: hypothetical protein LBT06_13130 [Hungatella sp.]|nr:hypothetical protein [Hungatella sp.]